MVQLQNFKHFWNILGHDLTDVFRDSCFQGESPGTMQTGGRLLVGRPDVFKEAETVLCKERSIYQTQSSY